MTCIMKELYTLIQIINTYSGTHIYVYRYRAHLYHLYHPYRGFGCMYTDNHSQCKRKELPKTVSWLRSGIYNICLTVSYVNLKMFSFISGSVVGCKMFYVTKENIIHIQIKLQWHKLKQLKNLWS